MTIVHTHLRSRDLRLLLRSPGFSEREKGKGCLGGDRGVCRLQLYPGPRTLLGMGKVTDILETGSNDVLVVKANLKDAFGQKERLIPFLDEQVIKSIDRTAQRIEVDWDPGF